MRKIIKVADFFFYIAFGIFLNMSMILDMAWFGSVDFTAFQMICFFLIVFFLILDNQYNRRFENPWLYFGMLTIFTIVAIRAANIRSLVLIVLFIISARNIEINKILKESYFIIAFYLILTVLLFYLGVFHDVEHSFFRQGTNIYRSSLGFSYTTYAPHYLLTLFTINVYLSRNKKHAVLSYFFFVLCGIWFYVETNTRTAFYETVLLFIFALIVRVFHINLAKHKVIRFLSNGIFIICAAVTFAVVLMYPSNFSWIRNLDQLLSYRITYSYYGLIQYGISLLGNPVNYVLSSNQYFYIDSSYVQLLIQYGPIVFTIIILLYTLLMRKNVIEQNSLGVLAVGIIAVRGITDPQMINLAYTPFMLSLGSSLTFIAAHRKQKRNAKKLLLKRS